MGLAPSSSTGESFADFTAFQGGRSASTDDFDPRGTGSVQGETAVRYLPCWLVAMLAGCTVFCLMMMITVLVVEVVVVVVVKAVIIVMMMMLVVIIMTIIISCY